MNTFDPSSVSDRPTGEKGRGVERRRVIHFTNPLVLLKEAQDAGLATSGLTFKDIPIARVTSYVEQVVEQLGAVRDEWKKSATEQSTKDRLRGASEAGGSVRTPAEPKTQADKDLANMAKYREG